MVTLKMLQLFQNEEIMGQSTKFFEKNLTKQFFDVEKWNVGNHLKRVLAKFRANQSHPRGVNGRSKFQKKIEVREVTFEKVTSYKNCTVFRLSVKKCDFFA